MVVVEKFEEAMTAEEKAKMYEAIGYHEGQGDPTLPAEVTCNYHIDFVFCER